MNCFCCYMKQFSNEKINDWEFWKERYFEFFPDCPEAEMRNSVCDKCGKDLIDFCRSKNIDNLDQL